MCIVSSLSHCFSWVPVLLFPWETELRVYQLLQHPSLQWAEAQKERQLCLSHQARASHHCPVLQLSPLLGTLLKLKEMPTPAASSVRPFLSHLPESLLGVLSFWVDRGSSCSLSSNAKSPRTNTFVSSEPIHSEFLCVVEEKAWSRKSRPSYPNLVNHRQG